MSGRFAWARWGRWFGHLIIMRQPEFGSFRDQFVLEVNIGISKSFVCIQGSCLLAASSCMFFEILIQYSIDFRLGLRNHWCGHALETSAFGLISTPVINIGIGISLPYWSMPMQVDAGKIPLEMPCSSHVSLLLHSAWSVQSWKSGKPSASMENHYIV